MKMLYSSGPLSAGQVDVLLANFEEVSYASRRDACIVVLVPCSECGRPFEELLVAAIARVRACRADFLCLACDSEADAPGLTGVVLIEGGQ